MGKSHIQFSGGTQQGEMLILSSLMCNIIIQTTPASQILTTYQDAPVEATNEGDNTINEAPTTKF